jgi:hypothetical protein
MRSRKVNERKPRAASERNTGQLQHQTLLGGGLDYFCRVKWSFLMLLAVVPLSGAQEARPENESEGMKRILHPSLNPATSLQDMSFYGGADKGFSTKSGNVKSFQWIDLFRLKSFAGSKKYGAKDYWTGDYEAGGKKARTQGNYSIPNAETKAEVKTNPVKEDRDAGKTQETRDYDKNRPYLVPGKAQKALDSEQEAQKPLTVDDVRKLLNTTR